MPFVNVKVVKDQISAEMKKQIIERLTDLIVQIMNRERALTTIVIDEIDYTSWAIGGNEIDRSVMEMPSKPQADGFNSSIIK